MEENKRCYKFAKNLYIGDESLAADEQFLLRHRISIVLCLGGSHPKEEAEEIDYIECGLPAQQVGQSEYSRIFEKLDKLCAYFTEIFRHTRNTLVYCDDTLDRSAFVYAYFLVKVQHMSSQAAIDTIIKHIPDFEFLVSHKSMLKVAAGEKVDSVFEKECAAKN